MRKTLAAIMAFGVAAVLSGATLAQADCAYHKTQAGINKTDPTKQVATSQTDEQEANQVRTAQTTPATQPAPVRK